LRKMPPKRKGKAIAKTIASDSEGSGQEEDEEYSGREDAENEEDDDEEEGDFDEEVFL